MSARSSETDTPCMHVMRTPDIQGYHITGERKTARQATAADPGLGTRDQTDIMHSLLFVTYIMHSRAPSGR